MSQPEAKKVFVAATRQNDGKTTTSVGLFKAFSRRFNRVAYIKPVGQQYHFINEAMIDKDAVLMNAIYNLQDPLPLMSPVAVPRGFTSEYIKGGNRQRLIDKIESAYQQLAIDKDFVLIEGTGHAGVGSVFDMNNAHVAKLLGSKVILVSRGGVGKPIDEIMMNKALFDQQGVEVLGVIVNKVKYEKYERISKTVRQGLKRLGLNVLGVIPEVDQLSTPSVAELAEDLGASWLSCDEHRLTQVVSHFVLGDKSPHRTLDSFEEGSVFIVHGHREDLIVTALCGDLLGGKQTSQISGLIFTDNLKPHQRILDLVARSGIPAMLVEEDAFSIAYRLQSSTFKLRGEESRKVELTQQLVEKYVDVDQICNLLDLASTRKRLEETVKGQSNFAGDDRAPNSVLELLERARLLMEIGGQRIVDVEAKERNLGRMADLLDAQASLAMASDRHVWKSQTTAVIKKMQVWLIDDNTLYDLQSIRHTEMQLRHDQLRRGLNLCNQLDKLETQILLPTPEGRPQLQKLEAALKKLLSEARHPPAYEPLRQALLTLRDSLNPPL